MVPERHRGKGRKETESWVRQAWYTRMSSTWEGSDTGEVEVRGEREERERTGRIQTQSLSLSEGYSLVSNTAFSAVAYKSLVA